MAEVQVVRSLAEAKSHDINHPAYVEVPGKWVRAVVWMVDKLEHPGDGEIGKTVRTLLRTLENPK